MKYLIIFTMLFSQTLFAQDYVAQARQEAMYNSCMSAWGDIRSNAALDEDKDALCKLPPFSYCLVKQKNRADRILNFNVQSCFNNLFNPAYPLEERMVSVGVVCRQAWLRVDGVISYAREEVCKKPGAAYCLADLVVKKAEIDAATATACVSSKERNELSRLGIWL